MRQITITRQELYAQVWSEPMLKLAKKYELSDVGFAKICKHHNIPRPPPGYWAKLQSGRKTSIPLLPEPDNNCDIRFRLLNKGRVLPPEVREKIKTELLSRNSEKLRVSIPENLRGAHALVSLARQQLEQAETDEDRLIIAPTDCALLIDVSKGSLRRALLIMDAALKALEELGHTVSTGPKVEIGGVRITFSISEALDSEKVQPKTHDLQGRYEFGHSRFITKYIPSGRLTLRINDGAAYWAGGCRKYWRDSEKTKIEDRLANFLSGLAEFAVRKKEYDLGRAQEEAQKREEERKREEKARERAEKLARWKEEQKSVETLMKEAQNWKKSQDLLHYIQAKKQIYLASKGAIAGENEFAEWIHWAEAQALRLNPLVDSPPSVLDEPVEEEEEPRRYW